MRRKAGEGTHMEVGGGENSYICIFHSSKPSHV